MKGVFDVYFLSPFWKRFPYYKHLLILGTTWCIHLNCFYNSHLLLQVVHCRKYPTISSYFRVTLPIFGKDNSSTAEREPYHAMTNVSNLALPTSSTSDEPKPEFSSLSEPELWRFRAEPSRAGALQFPSWNRADNTDNIYIK